MKEAVAGGLIRMRPAGRPIYSAVWDGTGWVNMFDISMRYWGGYGVDLTCSLHKETDRRVFETPPSFSPTRVDTGAKRPSPGSTRNKNTNTAPPSSSLTPSTHEFHPMESINRLNRDLIHQPTPSLLRTNHTTLRRANITFPHQEIKSKDDNTLKKGQSRSQNRPPSPEEKVMTPESKPAMDADRRIRTPDSS
ncbi:hypothetical protein YC2023_042239 [Brassica napus]